MEIPSLGPPGPIRPEGAPLRAIAPRDTKGAATSRQPKYKVRTIPFLRQLKKMIEVRGPPRLPAAPPPRARAAPRIARPRPRALRWRVSPRLDASAPSAQEEPTIIKWDMGNIIIPDPRELEPAAKKGAAVPFAPPYDYDPGRAPPPALRLGGAPAASEAAAPAAAAAAPPKKKGDGKDVVAAVSALLGLASN
ncbi:hypothetical protein SO694_00080171 [Aureococcus anophagefferens]|uniref:Uncharacterized protein n=1 Tax=Aureococcus anophagefferens TaxID=44056 RepID=A0ABR1G503_AURAN